MHCASPGTQHRNLYIRKPLLLEIQNDTLRSTSLSTEVDSRGYPALSLLQNHSSHVYHIVFPKILFCISHPSNHNFQRLLGDYFVKSKFGNLSRYDPLHSTDLIYSYFLDYPSPHMFVCYLCCMEYSSDYSLTLGFK